ncbi:MAG: DUF2892 domain-containing protein [Candidatus Nanopelagicales bacterium]
MTRNVGKTDRLVRAMAGLALLGLGVLTQAWPPVVVGVLLALTAALGFCPLYWFYGLSTIGGVHRSCADGRCGLPVPRR